MNEIISNSNIINTTGDYGIFKRLKGNRSVTNTRVTKIMNSINKVGYIKSPIVVNEKREVVDGQGRLQALKNLNLPIDYIIVPGIGIEECRAMNIDQSNWQVKDYIDSYAEDGFQDYIYFKNLVDRYKKIGLIAINNAITGLSGVDNNAVKRGDFICTKQQYDNAIKMLEYEKLFIPIVKKIDGRKDFWYIAFGFCFNHPDIDNDILLKKMEAGCNQAGSPANIIQALDEVQKIYCFHRKRGKRLYLSNDYQRMLDNKLSR